MQLSKENSDAGGATGASARPPAAAHPPLCLGQRGPGAYSPARPPRRKHSPTGTRAGAPHFAARLPSHLLWDLRGRGARTGHRAVPAGGAQSTRHHGARPRSAPPLPAPGPCPLGEEGVRSYLAQASVCHWGRRGRARPPPAPTRASRLLLNLQVTLRGERACALGLPGVGGARQAGGGGCQEGVRRGGAGPQEKKARSLQAVFVATTATGSPPVAPRVPCHYLGQCTAPSPLATQTFR